MSSKFVQLVASSTPVRVSVRGYGFGLNSLLTRPLDVHATPWIKRAFPESTTGGMELSLDFPAYSLLTSYFGTDRANPIRSFVGVQLRSRVFSS